MSTPTHTRQLSTLLLFLALAGCQTPSQTAAIPQAPTTTAGAVDGGVLVRCYRLDRTGSEVRLLVYRDGPLARFGHNHVIIGRTLSATIALAEPRSASTMHVRLAVADLEVDPPAARAEEGADFEGVVSDEARAGTRANMLGERVLDAATYPYVDVDLVSIQGPNWAPDLVLRIGLRDQVREIPVSVGLFESTDGLSVGGSFRIRQSAFGMAPFSVMGGGLAVSDEVGVRLRLQFSVIPASGPSTCAADQSDL